MLTFEGKPFNYYKNKAKQPPNKESSPNRFLLEKLYRVHRVRVLDARPAVETHVHIPDFIKNALGAKEVAKEHQQQRVTKENETIYRRIARAENAESHITKDAREHVRRVEHELVLMERLKKMGRARGILRVNRENEDIMMRIEHARPEYSIKAMKEWYKYHELFKKGRKVDPTAGHLGFRNMRGLMPTSLPPVNFDTTLEGGSRSNVDLAMDRAKYLAAKRGDGGLTLEALRGFDSPASSSSAALSPFTGGGFGSLSPPSISPIKSSTKKKNLLLQVDMTSEGIRKQPAPSPFGPLTIDVGSGSSGSGSGPGSRGQYEAGGGLTPMSGVFSAAEKKWGKRGKMIGSRGSDKSTPVLSRGVSRDGGGLTTPDLLSHANLKGHGEVFQDETPDSMFYSVENDDPAHIALLSKLCSIPFEDTNVILQILVARTYEECILVRLRSSAEPHDVLLDREVDIDHAFEVLNTYGSMMLNSDSVDLKSLRGQLIGLFQELDSDKSGFLSFDEFSELMSRSQVGINTDDLRHVLAEADDNGDGVVQYSEFVPLAIDMILAFRTKSQASKWVKHKDSQLDEEVMRRMKRMDIALMVDVVLMKVSDSDPKKTGQVRLSDLRRHLTQLSSKLGLTEVEIEWVLRHTTKGTMGRCRYDNIGELLTRSRFLLLKNGLQEETGTEVLKYLLRMCHDLHDEETRTSASEIGPARGTISSRLLSKALLSIDRYPITILQVSVFLSDEGHHGVIDYFSLMPVIARCIEILRDPKTLRQRAELIDPLGLSLDSGTILADKCKLDVESNSGASTPVVTQSTANPPTLGGRRSTLMSSSNASPLPSTRKSVLAAPAAPAAGTGRLSTPSSPSASCGSKPPSAAPPKSLFERRLRALFAASDADKNGGLNEAEFETALLTLDLHLTFDEILSLKTQADYDSNGEVTFEEFSLFFSENLASLERMKHMRALHSTLHPTQGQDDDEDKSGVGGGSTETTALEKERVSKELSDHLHDVFRLSDPNHTGKVDLHELERIIASLDVEITEFQVSSMVSEACLDFSGLVNYKATIPALVDLLMSFLSQQDANSVEAGFDKEAERRAHEITLAAFVDIYAIVSYIYRGLIAIDVQYDDEDEDSRERRYDSIRQLLVSPHSGLAQSEATFLLLRLFAPTQNKYESPARSNKMLSLLPIPQSLIILSEEQALAAKMHTSKRKSRGRPSETRRHIIPPQLSSIQNLRALQPTPTRALQEILDAVFDARKLTVMRGIMQNMPVKAIEKLLHTALVHTRDVLALRGKCTHNSIYLPIRECFVVLEESHHFRLTRPQIMGLVSWAECHDQTNTLIDFAAFATYAASMIKKLHNPGVQESRAQIVRMMTISESSKGGTGNKNNEHETLVRTALNGLSVQDLDTYLVDSFTSVQSTNETVDLEVFVDIISRIPNLRLSVKEAHTVAAAFPRTLEGGVYWPEFIPFAHTTFVSLCMERLLARRMVLGGGNPRPRNHPGSTETPSNTDSLESAVEGDEGEERSEEAIAALRKLAAGIIDHIEVRVSFGDHLAILLPGENLDDVEGGQEDDAGSADGDSHSVASFDSLGSIALEQLPSPAIKSILQRRKPNEMRFALDEIDEEGVHCAHEEDFKVTDSGVNGVTLFDRNVTMSVLVIKVPNTTNTRSSFNGLGAGGGQKSSNPRPSPEPSPVLTRRKTFVAPKEAAEPPIAKSMAVRFSVLCADPEVLTLDRSLIVTAGRSTAGAVVTPQGKNVTVPPFYIVCDQTVRLPSICLGTSRFPRASHSIHTS